MWTPRLPGGLRRRHARDAKGTSGPQERARSYHRPPALAPGGGRAGRASGLNARWAKTSQGLSVSSGLVVAVGPGGVLVVGGAGFEAAGEDADEAAGQAAGGGGVLVAGGALLVVEDPGAG